MDCQIDGIAKLAPIVAFYAGQPDMLEKVELAIRVTQNNDECVAETLAAARSVRPQAPFDYVILLLRLEGKRFHQTVGMVCVQAARQLSQSTTSQTTNWILPSGFWSISS